MNHILDNKIQLEDAQGDVFGLRTSGGVLIFDPCGMASTWLTRENCTQLWPIIKHFAETGELVETPNVIDNSIPARDDAAWSDRVTDNLVEIEERLEKLDVAIDCIGRGMTALDERLKAIEPKPARHKLIVLFMHGDPYIFVGESKDVSGQGWI